MKKIRDIRCLIGGLLLASSLLTACSHQQPTMESLFHPMDIGREVNVSCFEVEPNGAIWMGLDGNGLARRESANAPFLYYNKLSGTLPSDVVTCIYRTTSGRLWCGSFGNGLFYWDGKSFVQPDNEQLKGKNMEYIAGFAEDKRGRLWIATQKAGLACCETTDSITFYDKDNSPLATNWLADIKTFDRQTLYIASGWGLFTVDTENGQIAPLQDDDGNTLLEKQLIRILYPAPDGWLWIGTATGLYTWHKERHTVHHLTTEDGLGDNLVKAIAQDLHGNIWVTGNHSVTRIVVQKDDQDIHIEDCQTFSPGNGIGDGTFHVRAIARLTDGRMLFGHSKGCLTINPHDIPVGTSVVWWPWAVNIGVLSVLILLATATWRKRKKMQKEIKHAPIEPSTLEITSVDEQLKEKAIRIVEDHISDSEFSVEQLSEALGMSRGHLYKRLTAITGKTPIEFIRTIRIKQGLQLLEQSGENVSQIAWRIGMSPKQFAKYFKEEYGMLPSDFI